MKRSEAIVSVNSETDENVSKIPEVFLRTKVKCPKSVQSCIKLVVHSLNAASLRLSGSVADAEAEAASASTEAVGTDASCAVTSIPASSATCFMSASTASTGVVVVTALPIEDSRTC